MIITLLFNDTYVCIGTRYAAEKSLITITKYVNCTNILS